MKHLLINLTFLIYPEYLLKYFCTKNQPTFGLVFCILCIFLINNDWISAVNRIIDQCCLICRKVDTAMTSGATFISVSSERRLPGCIMKPLPIYKWHPVIYFLRCIHIPDCSGYMDLPCRQSAMLLCMSPCRLLVLH